MEPKQIAQTGRRTHIININRNYIYSLGLYISKLFIKIFIADLSNEVKSTWIHRLDRAYTQKEILRIIDDGIGKVINETSKITHGTSRIGIISIVVTASTSSDMKTIRYFNDLECLNNFALVPYMEKKYGYPSVMIKISMLRALSYLFDRSAKKMSSYIYLDITRGIGFGIVVDGKLYRGAFGNAGEIARLMLPNSNSDTMVENVYSTKNLYARMYEYINDKKLTHLKQRMEESNQNEQMLIAEYFLKNDEKETYPAIYDACHGWAKLCMMIIAFFDPKYLIIGGEINEKTPHIFALICDIIKKEMDIQTRIIIDKQKYSIESVIAMHVQDNLFDVICGKLKDL
jgi:predicted NBD/HSP70 family sugar kinase